MLRLNAGFSRKVGEANYSSRGASVNVDLELESALIQEPEKLHEKIRVLFAIAKKAVDEELKNGNGRDRPDREQPAQKPEAERSDTPVCAECGTGRISEKVVKFSTDKFGKPLCYRCQRKRGNGNERRR